MTFSKCTCLDSPSQKNHLEHLKSISLFWLILSLKKDGIRRNLHRFSEDLSNIHLLVNQMIFETEINFYSSFRHSMDNILVGILQYNFQKTLLVNILKIEEPFYFLCLKNKSFQFKNNKYLKQYFYLILIQCLLETIYRSRLIV